MPTERDALRDRLDHATAKLEPPVAAVDLASFDANARAIAGRAGGKPIRLATKSVRCRTLISRALATEGWHGVLAYSLAEALWLVDTAVTDDALVAYPTVDRTAIAALAADADLARAITLMVDDPAQLDLIDSVVAADRRPQLRVCLDLDASWRPLGRRLHVGVRRSPLHSAADTGRFAAQIVARRGFRLVGLMSYEAQIAGLGDAATDAYPGGALRVLGGAVRSTAIRTMQRRSYRDLLDRRRAAVAAARAHADLEFVNGGGTGSVRATAADPAVTEIAAGSGLYGPTLFDRYRAWRPRPSAFYALPVVRRPGPGFVTVAGGGWIASGPPGTDRLPLPWLPVGLRLVATEGAGEVQTPLTGPAVDRLAVGDRVWFRHAKAGELCEHVNELHLVDGDGLAGAAPTYRGEGQDFFG